ncbi:MAG TPA: hypothetical protein VFM02_01680 [Candidatus Paceibacterota bacterium]|nr:hypothetical protein [Candidatus Paceibacterota bacterium]
MERTKEKPLKIRGFSKRTRKNYFFFRVVFFAAFFFAGAFFFATFFLATFFFATFFFATFFFEAAFFFAGIKQKLFIPSKNFLKNKKTF